jgi:hypothetical protein
MVALQIISVNQRFYISFDCLSVTTNDRQAYRGPLRYASMDRGRRKTREIAAVLTDHQLSAVVIVAAIYSDQQDKKRRA